MLQDTNVERYVENAIKPLKKEIAKLKVQVEELNKALRTHDVSGELPISCVNDFEKPEYCSQRNNHLCQKCKDW